VEQNDSTRTEMMSVAVGIDLESSVGDKQEEEEGRASACAMTVEDVKYIEILFSVFTKNINNIAQIIPLNLNHCFFFLPCFLVSLPTTIALCLNESCIVLSNWNTNS
jgi:hypothetical protein